MSETKILSIWFFVGLMLTVLGVIITSTGIYYIFHPESNTAEMAHLNPSLWWGIIMLAAGLLFLIPAIRIHRKG
jgi:hypothetical protein